MRAKAGHRVGRPRLKLEEGFTLFELLAVIMLTAVVTVAVIAALSSVSGVFNSQGVRIQNQDDARAAINQMARYIRMATSSADNMTTQSNAIANALPQDIEFYCDVDGDEMAEKVRYYLDGTSLRMATAEPAWVTGTTPHYEYGAYETDGIVVQQAIRNGTDAVFGYYRYSGGGLEEFAPTSVALRQQVVTVSISVEVNEKPELARGAVLLATDVQIRQRFEGGVK